MFSELYAAFVVGQLSLGSASQVPVVVLFTALILGGILSKRWPPGSERRIEGFGPSELFCFVTGFGLMFFLNSLPTTYPGRLVMEYQLFFRVMGGFLAVYFGRRLLSLALSRRPRRMASSLGTLFFLIGLGLAAGWHPQTGVLLNSILIFAASAGNQGLWLLTAYTLGIIFPFIFMGLLLFAIAARVPARPLGIRVTIGSCGCVLLIFGVLLVLNRISFLTPGHWALFSY